MLKRIRESVRRRGFDVVRYPHPGSLGAHLRLLFDRLGIDLVLDIGGHRGEYGGFLRELGYRGAIHTFEPVPESFEALTRRLAGDAAWTGHPVALGDSDGEMEMRIMRSAVFSSAHRPTEYARRRFGDATRVDERIRVPARRLDGVLDDLLAADGAPADPAIFLKIDTQGSELDVLAGAGDVLDRVAALQAELPLKAVYEGVPPLWEMLPRLRELGFEPSGLFPVSIDRGDLALVEVDCVAVRTGMGAEAR
jgi:FkbM family methyltransferase